MNDVPAQSRVKWLWALLPLAGVLELALHARQVGRVVTADDWDHAAAELRPLVRAEDGISVAPFWASQVARRALGPLATFERFGVSDYTRYASVWELSLDGASELPNSWTIAERARTGRISVRERKNPSALPVISDLLSLAERGRDEDLSVSRGGIGHEAPCAWHRSVARVAADWEAWGVSRAAHYAQCASDASVGVQIISDHAFRPRRCLYVETSGQDAHTRLMFHNVKFGHILRMHAGLHHTQEDPQNHGDDVVTRALVRALNDDGSTSETLLGENIHKDGENWKEWDIDTSAVPEGAQGDLLIDVSSRQPHRGFCIEGSTR